MLAKGPVMRIETMYNPSSGEYRYACGHHCLIIRVIQDSLKIQG